jgi:membrane-associated protein
MITTLLYSLFALDQSLAALAADHAWLMFAAMFVVIFAETGLVVFPLLPGDSLLFVAGTVAAASGIDIHLLALTLVVAAVLGDSVNYSIGRFIGPKVLSRPRESRLGRWLKPEYMRRTHRFYEKYGGFTIIIGRFVPVVRTFAPFLAGVGRMRYRKFLTYNVIGGAAWISLLTYSGYLFGNIPWVKDNLAWIVVGIVIVSLMPIAFQWAREKRPRQKTPKKPKRNRPVAGS